MNAEIITFYVSSAGIAGDVDKLLIGTKGTTRLFEIFYDYGLFKNWNLKRAKKRLLKRFKLLEESHIHLSELGLFQNIDFRIIEDLSEGDLIIVKCNENLRPLEYDKIQNVMEGLNLKSKFLIVPPNIDIDKVIRNECKTENFNGANK